MLHLLAVLCKMPVAVTTQLPCARHCLALSPLHLVDLVQVLQQHHHRDEASNSEPYVAGM